MHMDYSYMYHYTKQISLVKIDIVYILLRNDHQFFQPDMRKQMHSVLQYILHHYIRLLYKVYLEKNKIHIYVNLSIQFHKYFHSTLLYIQLDKNIVYINFHLHCIDRNKYHHSNKDFE